MYRYTFICIPFVYINNNMINPRDSQGTVIHCPNSSCDYTWRYLGSFSFYVTCPSCRRNIKIAENKKEPQLQSVKVDRHNQMQLITVRQHEG
jgi:hypothetical protein